MIDLAKLIERHARYRPTATAVVCDERRLTYRDFWSRVARTGNALRDAGVDPGDKVATVAGNSLELLELYWAVPTIGAALVPLSPLLLAPGIASLVRGAQARCVIADAELAPALASVRDQLPRDVFLLGAGAGDLPDWRACVDRQAEVLVPAEVRHDDLFNVMFTSGTTGQPKGIMHTHFIRAMYATLMWDPLESTCRHASLSIL